MRSKLAIIVAAVAASAVAGAALADAKSDVAARQQHFKDMGKAFKAINDELKNSSPNVGLIRANANTMNQLAPNLPTWFPRGTGPETKLEMKAKPDVWTNPADFSAAAKRLAPEVAKLQQVAAAGDVEAIKAQARATGGACKNCHDKFRVPEER